MSVEFLVPSLRVMQNFSSDLCEKDSVKHEVHNRLLTLTQLCETRIISYHAQLVNKQRQKAWHDRHLRNKDLHPGDKVLLYSSKKHPWKSNFEVRVHLLLVGYFQTGSFNCKHLKEYPYTSSSMVVIYKGITKSSSSLILFDSTTIPFLYTYLILISFFLINKNKNISLSNISIESSTSNSTESLLGDLTEFFTLSLNRVFNSTFNRTFQSKSQPSL